MRKFDKINNLSNTVSFVFTDEAGVQVEVEVPNEASVVKLFQDILRSNRGSDLQNRIFNFCYENGSAADFVKYEAKVKDLLLKHHIKVTYL